MNINLIDEQLKNKYTGMELDKNNNKTVLEWYEIKNIITAILTSSF